MLRTETLINTPKGPALGDICLRGGEGWYAVLTEADGSRLERRYLRRATGDMAYHFLLQHGAGGDVQPVRVGDILEEHCSGPGTETCGYYRVTAIRPNEMDLEILDDDVRRQIVAKLSP